MMLMCRIASPGEMFLISPPALMHFCVFIMIIPIEDVTVLTALVKNYSTKYFYNTKVAGMSWQSFSPAKNLTIIPWVGF